MEPDWDLNEGLDPEGPSGADLDRFGDEMTRCNSCGGLMYDQAVECPRCGAYIEEEDGRVSVWVLLGVCGLVLLILWLVW